MRPEPEPEPSAPGEGRPQWLRNLIALWFAQFTAIFGFSFAFPFLPLYLRELGVTDPHQLPVWAGVATGASGAALAVMSPIWGMVADRYGRRQMLIRAMLGGAITVGLMGLVANPYQLVVLRLVQGGTSGTIAAATALVAAGTPRHRVAWAMGVLTSAVAVGGAAGPTVGGILASVLGIRHIFVIGGVLLGSALIPVLLVVREPPVERRAKDSPRTTDVLRAAGAGTFAALVVLLVCQTLLQLGYSGFQPLLSLRILDHIGGDRATTVTGIAFGISGLTAALAAVGYASSVRRWGYVRVVAVAAAGLAGAEIACGFVGSTVVIVVAGGLAGLFYGAVGPAISAMIGLETPTSVQARVFGISSSATAIGFALGPLTAGEMGSAAGVPWAMALLAGFALILMAVIATRGREPLR